MRCSHLRVGVCGGGCRAVCLCVGEEDVLIPWHKHTHRLMKPWEIVKKGERLLIDPYQNFHANPSQETECLLSELIIWFLGCPGQFQPAWGPNHSAVFPSESSCLGPTACHLSPSITSLPLLGLWPLPPARTVMEHMIETCWQIKFFKFQRRFAAEIALWRVWLAKC